ncbi:hypothetical protein ACDX34_16555 [Acinetobacter bereziniae]|uniref:DUF2004 domain-containing protein n=1 Tax=Acinetobacter junii TaxID=40215 RepID=A0AAX1MEC1_ACIJU|nr:MULTISPECIES: hypothetical protein [Acinetobacter]MCT8088771.1 hypothetical protein [Acinetobacter sp. F_3_1]MCT8096927.1 hypothetical protein [Acinetobacter sp. C_3_1]MCT8100080.1 hypothetical protein [Acinetobacter sp. C_4_1]MCT8134477.1 hypothetical protein [Acinetobacter sp. T_3_1]QUY35420.1 hypothetical protein H2677_09000 [Acinetobacter junii]
MKTLETEVGVFEFNYGWVKLINLNINEITYEIPLVFEAFEGENISEAQLKSYKLFMHEQSRYEQNILDLMSEYVLNESIQNPEFTPTSLLFKRDGSIGLICDCNWDIDQGIVIILYPNKVIKNQDLFL